MRCEHSIFNYLSLKLSIKALIICLVLLATLQIYADEKSAVLNATAQAQAADGAKAAQVQAAEKAKAAMEIVKSLLSNKSEVIVEEIPADVKAAVEKELSSRIKITKPKTNESASLVFRAPIYKVNQFLGYIAVVDGEVLELSKPNTNEKLPGYLKLIRDDFMLDSQEKAEMLESAIQAIIPYKLPKIVKPVKIDHGWIILRDDFFKNYSGLVFTTDQKGKITFVEYIMKINPKDYSYKKQVY